MPDLPHPPPEAGAPSLPPRPAPPRTPVEALTSWLAWFGVTRLVLAAVSVAVVAAGGYWLLHAPPPDAAAAVPISAAAASSPAATLPPPTMIAAPTTVPGPLVVHVAGQVAVPGVYTLAHGARVVAAIEAAGGVAADGDLDGLNLAAPLADGQRVYVPAVGEVDPAAVPDGAPSAADAGPHTPAGPIDLNTATATELETLPGVGPATAAAIVDDRTRNGPFATVDDLDRVPGIGPAKLSALADLVTV